MNLFLCKKTQVQIFMPLKNFLDLFLFRTYPVKKIDYILNDLVEKGEIGWQWENWKFELRLE